MEQEIKAFKITDAGTVVRTAEAPATPEIEYDQMCLNIIRVASNYDSILGSYWARRKCYKIAKKFEMRFDYKEHVQQLQLDYFPNEFKKSLIGESYLIWLVLSLSCITISVFGIFISLLNFSDMEGILLGVLCVISIFFFVWLIYYQTKKKKIEIAGLEDLHSNA